MRKRNSESTNDRPTFGSRVEVVRVNLSLMPGEVRILERVLRNAGLPFISYADNDMLLSASAQIIKALSEYGPDNRYQPSNDSHPARHAIYSNRKTALESIPNHFRTRRTRKKQHA